MSLFAPPTADAVSTVFYFSQPGRQRGLAGTARRGRRAPGSGWRTIWRGGLAVLLLLALAGCGSKAATTVGGGSTPAVAAASSAPGLPAGGAATGVTGTVGTAPAGAPGSAGSGSTAGTAGKAGTAGSATGAPPAATPPAPEMHRVVAIGPNLVEYIFEMHLQDRLVGVSDFCTYPPAAKSLPDVGSAIEPNLEKLIQLHPDLVLSSARAAKLEEMAERANYRFAATHIESLADIVAAPEQIATWMGLPGRGRGLTQRMTVDLDAVRTQVAHWPGRKTMAPPRVLVLIADGGDNRLTVGKGSYLTDLVELAGGQSVTAAVAKPYYRLDEEQIVQSRPDVILILGGKDWSAADQKKAVAAWDRFTEMPAVQAHHVTALATDYILIPGPRIAMAAEAFEQAIGAAACARPTTEPHGGAPGPGPGAGAAPTTEPHP